MKINFNTPLKDLEGEVLKRETTEGNKIIKTKNDFRLRDVCVNALLANIDNESENKIDGTEKMKRYLLATKIQKANKLDLKAEEITKLKELIGKVYGTLIVGEAFTLLEK